MNPEGLTAVSSGPDRIDLFWVGDGGLAHRRWRAGAGWSAVEWLGGEPASHPAAVSWAKDEMEVFVVGRDGHVWNSYWDGDHWHHWVDMDGEFDASHGVAASTWGADRIDLFATDLDGALWRRWWNGAEWVPWQREDGTA